MAERVSELERTGALAVDDSAAALRRVGRGAAAGASIFAKLGLPPDESDNRRVLAVLRYLGETAAARG